MDSSVDVRITGDASGAVEASRTSSSAVAEASALMKSKLAEIQTAARTAFGGMGDAAQAGAAKVAESAAIVSVAGDKMGLAAEKAKGHWEALGGVMGKLNAVFLGVTAVLAGGEVFNESIKASTQLASENRQLARAMGITLEKASGLHSAMSKLGLETDTVVGASQKMVRQLRQHENAFTGLGIATRDTNGHFRDTLDIMVDSLGKLGQYKEGVDRTALAQQMFGRGAGDLGALMRLTNKEIEEGARVAKELGLVTTTEGVTAMRNYKDATREVSEVFEAFKVALGNEMLPVLTDLAEWFRSSGVSALHAFVGVLQELIDEARRTVISIKLMGAEVNQFVVYLAGMVEGVGSACEVLKISFITAGKIIRDALTLNWGSIEGDWNAGMTQIDSTVTEHARHIAEQAGVAKNAVDALDRAWRSVGNRPGANQDGLGNPKDFFASGVIDKPDPTKLRADDISGKGGGGGAKEKKASKGPADNLLADWNTQLEQSLAAEKNWGVDETAFSLKFWEDKLALNKAKGKELTDLEGKIAKLKLQVHKQAQQEELKDDKQSSAMAEEAARTEIALAREALQVKLDLLDRESAAGQISARKAAKERAVLNAQIYQLDLDLENKLYQIKMRELKVAQSLYRIDTKEYRDYTRQIELLEQQHQDKILLIDRAANRKRAADQAAIVSQSRQRWTGMANDFAGSIARMATLQQGFGATFKGVWQSIQQTVAGILQQIVAKFITAQLIKLGLVKAEAAATIPAEAGKAGAGGTASMAAAPFPLNLGAAAFGASMAALAGSYGAVASAAGGWDVPSSAGRGVDGRGGMSAVIHPREMVLPADLADKVRGGGGGGDHYHFHGAMVQNPAQIKRWFEQNARGVGAGVRSFVRSGGNTSPNR